MSRKDEKWYDGGVCFECQPDCGNCCVNHGDYAYVYLEGEDSAKLAALLGLNQAAFEDKYTERQEEHLTLRMDQPACPFLDGTRCTVYDARPTQCRTFPFWESNLNSRGAWERLRGFCPGIDQGEKHPLAVINKHLTEFDA